MSKFEHDKLKKIFLTLAEVPHEDEEIAIWIKAEKHLKFLKANSNDSEIIIYGLDSSHCFVHSLAVPEELLEPLDKNDLMKWSTNPFTAAAGYVFWSGSDEVSIERKNSTCSDILDNSTNLIYARSFDGMKGVDSDYIELSQEYAHIEELHWRPEIGGYCRFDIEGELDSIVSVTNGLGTDSLSLVTFNRDSLDSYLAASKQVLVGSVNSTLSIKNYLKNKDKLIY